MRPSSSLHRSASPVLTPGPISESSASSISFESSPQMLQHDPPVVPIAPLSQFLDLLTPLPPATSTAADHARRLLKDRPSFFFIFEIPCARKYVAVARSGLFATFDSSCLSCTLINTLCCDSHGAPPPLLCAAVTSAYSACLPPVTIDGSSPAPQLSSPRRRAPPCPRGDVLAAITCHSVICLYDLAAVANGNVGASTDGHLQPIVKIIIGFKVVLSSNPAHKPQTRARCNILIPPSPPLPPRPFRLPTAYHWRQQHSHSPLLLVMLLPLPPKNMLVLPAAVAACGCSDVHPCALRLLPTP
jgi:hypothetical protein